jgi:hypothetical protein
MLKKLHLLGDIVYADNVNYVSLDFQKDNGT